MAENIDPDNHDSQYAWAENVGWINTEPLGDGGPGVQVDDFELTGWMWGENIGWISLSCKNDSTCGTTEYGVINDGNGVLSGYAWGENVGWINFSPSTAGVFIGVASGEFRGQAWGENVGWISFASTGTNPFAVMTSWNCDPAPAPPSGSVACTVSKSGTDAVLSWDGLPDATGYGIVKGNLGKLQLADGDFSLATEECLSSNHTTTSLSHSAVPPTGEGFWYLVRGENCGGKGTYSSEVDVDAEIAASGHDCP